VSVSSSPIEFDKSVPKTLLGIIVDNTEFIDAAKALEESEKRYKSLAENFPNGTVALFNREMVCEFVDGKGLETIGLKKENLIGRNIYEIFPEDIARIKEENWTKVFNGESSSYEVNFKNCIFTTTVVPIRNTEGKILQGAAFSQDITRLRRYQNEQEKSKTLLEMSEDIAGSGSFETDYVEQEILVSKGWQQIHGINKDLISVEEFVGIVKHEDVETMIKVCEKARAEHTDYHYQVRIINQQTRDIRHTKVIGKYKYNENNEVVSMVGSVQDITEQKRIGEEKIKMAEELRQSQKMEAIGALAGGVAHDFNNIMQSVIGYSQLMLETLPKDSQEYDNASEIFRGAERAAAITRQLLAFGRRQVLEPSEIDLNKHIASIQDLLERTTKETIRVSFSPKRGLPLVSVDKNQLTQLILNVVTNARDAMPNGGIVELSTSQVHIDKSYNESYFTSTEKPGEGMYVMLRISDTGEGMSQGVLSHIFEPFYTTKAVGKGTGMGLSSVYGIIRQHGGGIRAESKVGKGSSFFIYLPAVAKGTSKKGIKVPDEKKPDKGSGTILFAEDEPVLRKLSKKVLGDYGYTMIMAENGQEALDLGRENIYNIDILVFDAVMPKMSGIDAYKALRELRPELPVIFTSGYTESEIHSNYILKHGLTFIQKPYSLKDLLKKIQEMQANK
jgi:PAS domain S-box-containing protein